MEQYISKSALVAEIESKIEKYTKRGEESDAKCDGCGMYWGGVLSCLNEVKTLINTLEVKEEPVSENFEKALASEWKGYNDRGAATVDALEGNAQELTAFAKGFYRGANWQKEQMIKEIVAEQECKCMQITHRIIGGSWNLTCPTDKMGLKDGDKVKIKIIKED